MIPLVAVRMLGMTRSRLALQKAARSVQVVSTKKVLVGIPKGSGSYPNGESIAFIAAINEFGSSDGRIPERSFLRVGVRNSKEDVTRIYKKCIPLIAAKKMSELNMQQLVGESCVGHVVELISDGVPPPNEPSTIAKKGSSKPLIDTGALRQSITYLVVDKNATGGE